jgi:hypothetical protein
MSVKAHRSKSTTAPPAPGTLAAGRAARQAACDHHRGITDGQRHVCLLCGAVLTLADVFRNLPSS